MTGRKESFSKVLLIPNPSYFRCATMK